MNNTKPKNHMTYMSCLFFLLLCMLFSGVVIAAPSNVRVIGVSNTQAIIAFTYDPSQACTVEVSEESDFTPLVHDVNSTLFSGSNSCSRASSVGYGAQVEFVVGLRTVQTAADGLNYSRSLQAATLHYFRITNGSSVTGTFTTDTLPLGRSRTDPYIPDTTYLGEPKEISFDMTTRNATVIDPHTGVQSRLLQLPGDHTEISFSSSPRPLSVVSSTNWTNPSNFVGTTPATYATFDGATCSPDCDGIIVEATTGIGFSYQHANGTDWYAFAASGLASSGTAADRTFNVCLVTNETVYFQAYPPANGSTSYNRGTVCDPNPAAVVKQFILPQGSEGDVSIQDSFRLPGHTVHVHGFQIAQNDVAKPRFKIWKANGNGTASIRNATFKWRGSNVANVGSAGEFKRCSTVMRSDGTYLCMTAKETGSIYSINGSTGEVRFLGVIKYITGIGPQYCNLDHVPWSDTDANTWLCTQTANSAIIGKFTYTGNGANKAQDYVLTLNTDFTVEWIISDLKGILNTFYAAHESEYYTMLGGAGNFNRFNVGPFTSCSIISTQRVDSADYYVGGCRSTNADTPSWQFALNSDGTVKSLTPMYGTASARWCSNHYQAVIEQPIMNVFGQKTMYQATLVGAIDSDDATITVTSSCTGDCDGFHEGDPVAYDMTMAAESLMPLQVGDRLSLSWKPSMGSIGDFSSTVEMVRITSKISNTQYGISRAQQGTTAKSHLNGAIVHPVCSSWPNSTGSSFESYYYIAADGRDHSAEWGWKFATDLYGQSTDGTGVWASPYKGHTAAVENVYTNGNINTVSAPGTFVMEAAKDLATTWYQWEPIGFGGVNGIGTGNCYQSHVSLFGKSGSGPLRESMWNAHPLVGGCFTTTPASCDIDAAPIDVNPTTGCPLGRISGTSYTYRYVHDNPNYPFSPKHFEPYGAAAYKVLRNISGPSSTISDATPYTFCIAVAANECRTGSSAGQIFVSVPDTIGKPYCSGGESFSGSFDVCIGNTEWKNSGSTQMVYGINSKTGLYSVAAGYETVANGSGGIRLLARHALSGGYRRMPGFSSTKPLANARYALADWAHVSEGTRMVVLKIPPVVVDSINRADWYPLTIPISSVPSGTNNVVAKFGYLENGTKTQFYCTQRAEACVAHRNTVNSSNPFSYATTESATVGSGLACSSSCSLVIPTVSGRVVYYQVEFRDGSNNVLTTTPVKIAVIP